MKKWMLLALLALLAAACKPATATPAVQTPTVAAAVTLEPTATLPPAASPTPALPGLILLAPDGAAAPTLGEMLDRLLKAEAERSGLTYETRAALDPAGMGPAARLVVVLPGAGGADPGVAALAAASPQTQFLAVDIPGVAAGGNVSVASTAGGRPDQRGFIAGFLAALYTYDWRIAVIAPPATVEGKAARLGFVNGAVFFCGLCRPSYPPFLQYPALADLDPGGAEGAVVDLLVGQAVQTVFVDPAVATESLYRALAEKKMFIIGSGTPPAGIEANWVASLDSDLEAVLASALTGLLAGQGGQTIASGLALTQVNSDQLSAGRQQMVADTLADLLGGWIDTGVDPLTGDAR